MSQTARKVQYNPYLTFLQALMGFMFQKSPAEIKINQQKGSEYINFEQEFFRGKLQEKTHFFQKIFSQVLNHFWGKSN